MNVDTTRLIILVTTVLVPSWQPKKKPNYTAGYLTDLPSKGLIQDFCKVADRDG